MGKYIKYFNTIEEFAEYWNFAEWAPGPDEGDDTTMVAYVTESDKVYYYNSDMSEFNVNFSAQSSEIDATADTVTFNVKTGLFYLDVYHNGELVNTYKPGVDNSVRFEVAENLSPLTVTENFVGKWYKDNEGEKGDYITEFQQPITHNPDPEAPPVKLTIEAISYRLDGAGPIRLGNASLTGATRILMDESGNWEDITSSVYVSNKRLWYDVPGDGSWIFKFEFESEDQVVGDYFYASQLKSLEISTNYPELGAQTNFVFNGPLMQSSIQKIELGEGMQRVSSGALMMANSLNYIYAAGDVLPVPPDQFFGLQANGTFEADSRDAENFQNWVNALPSDWTILPEPGPTPVEGTVGKLTLKFDIDSINDNPIVGGIYVMSEFSGTMEAYDPNGQQISSDDFQVYLDKQNNTRFYVPNYTDGEYTLVLRRESTDLLLQDWFAGGEFKSAKYEEEAFDVGSVHISLYEGAFSGCTNLETVELGENCAGVSLTAFDGCSNLTEIICHPATEIPLTDLSQIQFSTIAQNTGTLEIPSGSSYSNWEAALGSNWTVVDDL